MGKTKKKNIANKNYLTSTIFHDYVVSLFEPVCKAYNLKAPTYNLDYDPLSTKSAYTDNHLIYLNSGCKLADSQATTKQKMEIIVGLATHETAHRIFTSFKALKQFMASTINQKFYPTRPFILNEHVDNLNKLENEYLADKEKARKLAKIGQAIANCVEDGRIEYLFLSLSKDFPYQKSCLKKLRDVHFNEMKDYTELKELNTLAQDDIKYRDNLSCLMEMILSYSKFGKIKGFDKHSNGLLADAFRPLQRYINSGLKTENGVDLFRCTNAILVGIFPYIKDYLDMENDSKFEELLEVMSSKIKGSTMSGKGSGIGISSDVIKSLKRCSRIPSYSEGEEGLDPRDISSVPTDDELSSFDSSDNADDEDISDKDLNDENSDHGVTSLDDTNEMETDENEDTTDGKDDSDYITDNEDDTIMNPERHELSETDNVWRTIANSLASEIKADKSILENRLADVIDSIEESEIEKVDAEARQKALDETIAKCDFDEIHEGVSCNIVNYDVTNHSKRIYKEISKEVLLLAKQAARKIQPLLDVDNRAKLKKNQYIGKKFNATSVCRNDFRYFSSKKEKASPKVAVGMRIDLSGSMMGKRVEVARATSILLHEMCMQLNIPVGIYGDDANYAVNLHIFSDFETSNMNDKYRLANMRAGYENRDGYAITFVKHRMNLVDAKTKILFIISDGQPCDFGYEGTAAELDIQHVISKCERDGIKVVAIGIGSDRENLKRIYGQNNYIDITDLDSLPQKLATILKRKI